MCEPRHWRYVSVLLPELMLPLSLYHILHNSAMPISKMLRISRDTKYLMIAWAFALSKYSLIKLPASSLFIRLHFGMPHCFRGHYDSCACTAVNATTPTMSSQEHPRERSLTGLAIPWSIGPYASALPSLCTSL